MKSVLDKNHGDNFLSIISLHKITKHYQCRVFHCGDMLLEEKVPQRQSAETQVGYPQHVVLV
jgi:hypothetical protein